MMAMVESRSGDCYEGLVEFDPMDYAANRYEVYDVIVCDARTGLRIGSEHYSNLTTYASALRDTPGRMWRGDSEAHEDVIVIANGESYECEAIHHITYVYDEEVHLWQP